VNVLGANTLENKFSVPGSLPGNFPPVSESSRERVGQGAQEDEGGKGPGSELARVLSAKFVPG